MFFGMEQIAVAVSSSAPELLKVIVDHGIKGSLLILLAWAITRLLKSEPAAVRHFVWTVTISVVVMMPLLSLVMPAIEIPFLPGSIFQEFEALAALESAQAVDSQTVITEAETGIFSAMPFDLSWPVLLVSIWLSGATLVFLWLSMGKIRAWRMLILAHALDDETLLDVARVAAEQIGLTPGWKIKVSDAVDVPLVVGNFGRTVLLPEEAYDWTREKLLILLLHEMTHIKRRDMMLQIPAEISTVLFWFNPLVWYASHRQIIERELAADDHVLNRGVKVSDYATQLLEAANCLKRGSSKAFSGAGMARGTDFKKRLVKVLSQETNRKPLEKRYSFLILLAITLLGLPLSAWQTWTQEEPWMMDEGRFSTALEILFSDVVTPDGPEAFTGRNHQNQRSFKAVATVRDSRPYAERLSYTKNPGRANNPQGRIDSEVDEQKQQEEVQNLRVVKPKMVRFVKPHFPLLAKRRGISSSVHLKAIIDHNGIVSDVQVIRESHKNLGFKEFAVEALKECRFAPALVGGRPVKVETGINIRFEVH